MPDDIVVSEVDWFERQATLRDIRTRVFIEEQNVPQELEWDDADPVCTHFLATFNGEPAGTARLTPAGQIGRMAVLKPFRMRGTGARLLQRALDTAKLHEYNEVFLHAQVSVVPFYEKYGFIPEGNIFVEAGIEHLTMRRQLK